MTSQSRILIFCGKGGVGKTTLALALGLRRANAGRKVVIVTSHPLPELSVAVSLDGLAEQYPLAAQNLFIVHLDSKQLLAEVVEENFPVQWVARTVLNSKIYQNLIEVAPGLKEFYFLARLQRLAERKTAVRGAGSLDYDLLIWDAPSTGHFLSTLRAARNFEVYLTGPLASAGAEIARFFSNASAIAVLPTTTLEEMAVQETIEMCRALEREHQLKPTTLLLNLVSPLVTTSDADVNPLRASAAGPGLRFAVERGLIERQCAAELRAALPGPVATAIPRLTHTSGDLDLLRRAGDRLEAAIP